MPASSGFAALDAVRELPPPLTTLVSFDFRAIPLRAAVDSIARRAGFSFVADNRLPGLSRPVTLRGTDMRAGAALARALSGSGIVAMLSPTGQVVLVAAPVGSTTSTATILWRGVVRDAESGAPVEGARIEVPLAHVSVLSRDSGQFEFKLPQPGAYALRVTRLGYAPVVMPAQYVDAEARPPLALLMTRASVALASVVVTPGTFGMMQNGVAASQTFSRAQIEAAPQIGEDIYRAVNRLPGIAADDFSSDFRVRGGSGSELYTTLDGMELIRPFHLEDLGGSFSILDVKSIGAVDLTLGGLTADIGNRLTGAFAMQSVEPMTDRVHTSLGISLMNARGQAQGGFAEGRGGWLASYRRGYLELALKLASAGDSLTPKYDDAFAKVHYDLPEEWFASGRVTAHVLHAGDNLSYASRDGQIRSRYASDYAWLSWSGRVGQSPSPDGGDARLRQSTILSATRASQSRVGAQHDDRTLDGSVNDDRNTSSIKARQDWTLTLSPRVVVRWGGEAARERAQYAYASSILRDSSLPREPNGVRARVPYVDSSRVQLAPSSVLAGTYATARVRPFASLTLEAGLRYDRNSATDDALVLPRANVAWEATSRTTLRGAWGATAQSQSVGTIHVENGDQALLPAKRAVHQILGLDQRFANGLLGRVELYNRDQTALWPYGANNADGSVELLPELTWDHLRVVPTAGRARGAEFLVRREHGQTLDWTASYVLAEAREQVNGVWIASQADQRHAVNLDGTFHPDDDRWRLSVAFTWHSGWPYTTTFVRVDTVARFPDHYQLAGYIANDTYNGATLPAYQRFDVRWMRFIDTAHWHGSVFAEIYNVLNADNTRGYYTYVQFDGRGGFLRRVNPTAAIPRLPAIGLSWDF
ncbi:MAG: TonB-dependent receptor [bacterium]